MAERRYDISNDIGIQHSTLIASDEGFTIQPEELRRRAGSGYRGHRSRHQRGEPVRHPPAEDG